MALYQHPLFTIDLNKVIAVYQNEDEVTITILMDDQRKIEGANDTPEAALEFLNELADRWGQVGARLLRYGRHVCLATAIYSLQVDADTVMINFRDQSISFSVGDPQQALGRLAEMTLRWQEAIGEAPTS